MDETRQAVLDAASTLLQQEGPDALSNRRVAKAAGCTTMAIYSRFGSKGGILAGLFAEGVEQLAAAQAAVPRTDDPVADVRALCRAYRRTAHAFPGHYALIFGQPVPGWQPDEHLRQAARATFEHLISAVARVTGPEAAPTMAWELWVACHGHVSAEQRGYGAMLPDLDVVFEDMVLRLLGTMGHADGRG